MKDSWQRLQLKDFSPVWSPICLFKLDDVEMDFWQRSQRYGFSPVWILICVFKLYDWVKEFRQRLQLKDFSTAWIFIMWSDRCCCLVNLIWQYSQLSAFSSVLRFIFSDFKQMDWKKGSPFLFSCWLSDISALSFLVLKWIRYCEVCWKKLKFLNISVS